jgi:ferredoxin
LKERIAWEEEKEKQIQAIRAEPAQADHSQPVEAVTVPAVTEDAEEPDTPAEAAVPAVSDDPYIDTPRCTTCDECTNKNDRMFAYDENKQAYIKDLDAGTFKDLVEAAELCQVAIIHPGKPRNQNEPGLEELIKRAEPFMA